MKQSKKRVFLVDDHPVVRQGLAQLIDHEADLQVCGEAEEAYQALEKIDQAKPDIVIVDISLKGISGLELVKMIRSQNPSLPVLALSMHDENLYAERILRAGAKGYIMKKEPPEKIISAIRTTLGGQIYVSEKITNRMVEKIAGNRPAAESSVIDLLTDRELEVFQLIGKGRGTREIAEELHLSIKTIESYRANIKEKLKLKTAAEMVHHAVQWVQDKL